MKQELPEQKHRASMTDLRSKTTMMRVRGRLPMQHDAHGMGRCESSSCYSEQLAVQNWVLPTLFSAPVLFRGWFDFEITTITMEGIRLGGHVQSQ